MFKFTFYFRESILRNVSHYTVINAHWHLQDNKKITINPIHIFDRLELLSSVCRAILNQVAFGVFSSGEKYSLVYFFIPKLPHWIVISSETLTAL